MEMRGFNMLGTLPESLTSYSNLSKTNVSLLIREMKLDKSQFNSLIQKMNNYNFGTEFAAQKVGAGIELNREILVDLFRDSSIRISRFFKGANAIGLALNSMIEVLSSEIQKIENDLNYLEAFINNYEFISGKDDMYDNNYIEKFDTLQNHYKYDGYSFTINDKDGTTFPLDGNVKIDYTKGVIGIGNSDVYKNVIDNIGTIIINSNHENDISSQSNFDNVFTDNKQDAWTRTIKSKNIIGAGLTGFNSYIPYSQVGLKGARTAVEVLFNNTVRADKIRINPNYAEGMQLLQIVLFTPVGNTNSNTSENYTLCMRSPQRLDKTLDIFFNVTNISKVIFIFNQPIYFRSKLTALTSEMNSKLINNFINDKMSYKRNRFSILQDIVYNQFKRKYTIKGVSKNTKNSDKFYSNRFPIEKNDYFELISSEIFRASNSEFDDKKLLSESPVFVDLFYSMLSHMDKDIFESYSNLYIENNSNNSSSSLLAYPGFIPYGNTNTKNNQKYQFYETIRQLGGSSDAVRKLLINEPSDLYEYNFSINSIDFIETSSESNSKACFVSKKIPVDGQVAAIKADLQIDNEEFEVLTPSMLRYPVSYELSVSNEEIPVNESSWTPILPNKKVAVDAEVVFFDTTDYSYQLRFTAKQDTILLYKNGLRVSPSLYSYSLPSNRITLLQTNIYSSTDIFCVSYLVDISLKNPYEIDLNTNAGYKKLIKRYSTSLGYGQKFTNTDINSSVVLEYNPYVNQDYLKDATYINGFGTLFMNTNYSPIRIQLSNGSIATNITNYSNIIEKVSFYNTDLILYMHSGKNIIFNKPINSPFTVDYEYAPYNLRFKLVMRQTTNSMPLASNADAVILKMKTAKFDNYYNKLNKTFI
jgi:hypothetical protein